MFCMPFKKTLIKKTQLTLKTLKRTPTCKLQLKPEIHSLERRVVGALQRAEPLVQHRLLRAEQQGGRDIPGERDVGDRGRLHQPVVELQPLLPRPGLQRQPELDHREHQEAHRERFVENMVFVFLIFL